MGDDLMGVHFALAPASFPVYGEPDCRVSRRSYICQRSAGVCSVGGRCTLTLSLLCVFLMPRAMFVRIFDVPVFLLFFHSRICPSRDPRATHPSTFVAVRACWKIYSWK